jgi:hypothetical protein
VFFSISSFNYQLVALHPKKDCFPVPLIYTIRYNDGDLFMELGGGDFFKKTIGMDAGRILIVFSKNIASSKFH